MDETAEYSGLLIGQQLHIVVATSHVALRYEQTRKTPSREFNVRYVKNHPRRANRKAFVSRTMFYSEFWKFHHHSSMRYCRMRIKKKRKKKRKLETEPEEERQESREKPSRSRLPSSAWSISWQLQLEGITVALWLMLKSTNFKLQSNPP